MDPRNFFDYGKILVRVRDSEAFMKEGLAGFTHDEGAGEFSMLKDDLTRVVN